jgi:isoaspartyl peptidase/L-asparaginase-like protein (Ntn-hydrolase superfamily)
MLASERLRVISTWSFGMPANEVAWRLLCEGRPALDAAIEGVVNCEDNPDADSVGFGGTPDAEGNVSLDASVMDHAGHCGAVAGVRKLRNPIRAARLVMETTPHVLLVGEAADRFGIERGLAQGGLLSDAAAQRYRDWKTSQIPMPGHDTIGLLTLDRDGKLAGACSTSGTPFKVPGRVGDSPIIGAGLYVDGDVGAVAATGVGEEVIKVCGSFAVMENLRRGMDPADAIADGLLRIARRRGDRDVDVAFIALTASGETAGMSMRKEMKFVFAVSTPSEKSLRVAECLA